MEKYRNIQILESGDFASFFFKVRHAICKYLCILTATMN